MKEIVNKFLLAGDKFMPEMHLKQRGFTYSARGSFTKNKERIQKQSDLADIQLISKCNKGWVVPLKNKKGASIVDVFSKNIGRFKQKTKQNMG